MATNKSLFSLIYFLYKLSTICNFKVDLLLYSYYIVYMESKLVKTNLKVGDKVEIYLNKSKLHSGYFDVWVDGQVVGFTAKKIKVLNFGTADKFKDPKYPLAYYLPKYVRKVN